MRTEVLSYQNRSPHYDYNQFALATHCPEPELAKFYRGLMASEARHFGTYWVLADTYFDRQIVMQRLDELAIAESGLLSSLYPHPRIHS